MKNHETTKDGIGMGFDDMLIYACSSGNREAFAVACLSGGDPNAKSNAAIKLAAKNGQREMLMHMLRKMDVTLSDDGMILWAAKNEDAEILEAVKNVVKKNGEHGQKLLATALRTIAGSDIHACIPNIADICENDTIGKALCLSMQKPDAVEKIISLQIEDRWKISALAGGTREFHRLSCRNDPEACERAASISTSCQKILKTMDIPAIMGNLDADENFEAISFLQSEILSMTVFGEPSRLEIIAARR